MSDELETRLTKILLSLAASLELSDESCINEDFALRLMEDVGAELSSMSQTERARFCEIVQTLEFPRDSNREKFYREFCVTLGVVDS